jgi:hypothetical protein
MLTTFEQSADERRGHGWAVFICFTLGELIGLLIGAGAEWIAKFTSDSSVRARCLPDLRMMRPPGVTRETFFARAGANVPAEVMKAQRGADFLRSRM